MAELPHGTITFLFTDIEGSTRLLKQLGERYATARADHHRILRAAFEEHDGQEIDTQGDAFFVAFRRAKDAVAAAAAAQRGLAANEWPDGTELRVRMGMHTGEPSVSNEGYLGLGVHRAARICSAGHGGQVLLSEAGSLGLRAASVYDKCDTLVEVAERAISLRLDAEATRALELLVRDGKSRSEAIREAVVDTARRRLNEIAAADAARVGADEGDRREVAAVQALMEELSEER